MAGSEKETFTDLAAAPPEAPPPARGVRLRHYLAMATVLAIAGTAAWLIIVRLERGYQYREEVRSILEPLGSGEAARIEEVYESASPRFKQTLILDKFVDLVDRMNRTLGGFRGIVEVIEVDRMSTVAGRAVRIKLLLEFEHSRTTGELSFLRDEDPAAGERPKERLLGFSVDIPATLAAKAEELERERGRLVAPDEVIESVERVLAKLREGRVAEIRDEAAPAFKITVSEQALRDLTSSHAEELGAFKGLVKIITSAQNQNKDRARVQALLEYDKRRTTATFDFQKLEARWQLLAFRVIVPEPFSPLSGPPPDDDDGVVGE